SIRGQAQGPHILSPYPLVPTGRERPSLPHSFVTYHQDEEVISCTITRIRVAKTSMLDHIHYYKFIAIASSGVFVSCSSRTDRKAATTWGSNWVPEQRCNSALAASMDMGSR